MAEDKWLTSLVPPAAATIPQIATDVMATDMFSRPVRVATAMVKSMSSATVGSSLVDLQSSVFTGKTKGIHLTSVSL